MRANEKVALSKMSLLEPAEHRKNVSKARRVMGVPRRHFHDIRSS